MQKQSIIPNVPDKTVKLRSDERGVFVRTVGSRWYAHAPGPASIGQQVIVRFDIPGSKTVSVWRFDRPLGEFTRD